MLGTFWHENRVDENGNPAGGSLSGKGLSIEWQDGPLGRGEDRQEPNGAFVETVIAAAESRLEFYQEGKFACADNAEALDLLKQARAVLNRRTLRREAQGVEGTHKIDVPVEPPAPPVETPSEPKPPVEQPKPLAPEGGCVVSEADLAQFAERTAATAEKLNDVLEGVIETGALNTECFKGVN